MKPSLRNEKNISFSIGYKWYKMTNFSNFFIINHYKDKPGLRFYYEGFRSLCILNKNFLRTLGKIIIKLVK